MAEKSGRAGGVFTGETIIDNGEAGWDAEDGAVTCTADATYFKTGTHSAKMACTDVLGATTLAATQDVTVNLTTYDVLQMWIRSSVILAADDWRFYIDETADCADPDKTLQVPAMAADTWTRCCFDLGDTSALDAVISIGVYQKVDKGAMDLYIDDVSALSIIEGIKSWTLDYTLDTIDISDFADGAATNAARTFLPGLSSWSGSFEGYKDGVPQALSFGSAVTLILAESQTDGQAWIGDAYITGIHANVPVDGVITYSYDFQGTGELTEAVA